MCIRDRVAHHRLFPEGGPPGLGQIGGQGVVAELLEGGQTPRLGGGQLGPDVYKRQSKGRFV